MSELIMTTEERTRVEMFIREQAMDWEQQEQQKAFLASRKGEKYEVKDFPGFDENAALQAIRSGWKSKLDLMFEKKFRKEGVRQ